jgi:hypothetical protein
MTTIELFGQVNENGELEIEPPQGLHAGKKVKVTITELDEGSSNEHWGKKFVALLDQLDFGESEMDDGSDPVEWVKKQREQEAKQRGLDQSGE